MLRYFALATVIVLAVAVAVAGWVNRDVIRIRIASAYGAVPPKPEPSSTVGSASEKGLYGDAPWALSALPECLVQTSETTGPPAFVHGHLPAGVVPVAVPATLKYGDCTILLTDDEAYVNRGDDRFRIPPRVRFYRAPGVLALLREDPNGNELRVYESPTDNR
jgi:hypothetical protein